MFVAANGENVIKINACRAEKNTTKKLDVFIHLMSFTDHPREIDILSITTWMKTRVKVKRSRSGGPLWREFAREFA